MAANLVIVESPAKAKTIQRYLGDDFEVLASYGHIRDLPRSDFAVQVHDGGGCDLDYVVPNASKKHVAALRKASKDATVWLAPDLDREGEAIAWHIADTLGLDVAETRRVTFDSITKEAILEAFESPRTLNMDLVDAQQARRAVDRIVGYRLSPVLWRTVSSGISAGRVQSVALRIIVDRENEIRAFDPQEYWDFDATLADKEMRDDTFDARLYAVGAQRLAKPQDIEKAAGNDKKLAALLLVGDEDHANDLRSRALGQDYTVTQVRRTEARQRPKAPFTTSTLQQDAANRLGFSAARTMRTAQQLYEGMRIGGEEVGLITYMRTDSVNLSNQALGEITSLVAERFGDAYTLDKPRHHSRKTKGAQEAHEAIRPTSVFRSPDRVASALKPDQLKLYDLIWKRTVATQMADAVKDRVSADVVSDGATDGVGDFTFRVTGQVLKFDGFIKVYTNWRDPDAEPDEEAEGLPEINEGQRLDLAELLANQHFTTPPPRYTEATLVKTLEAEGIGRPSTYASIIQTLVNREYVDLESRRFFPTPLGEVVVVFLKNHFTEVVDVNFTSRMEETLDEIAAGDEQWCTTVTRFLEEVDTWVSERKPERPREPLLIPADCPECGSPMERVFSGKSKQWFASCSRWPDCDGTLPLNDDGSVGEPEPEPEPDPNVVCPEDGGLMIPREGKFGLFYGCQNYPKCKGILNVQNRAVYRDGDGEIVAFRSPTDPNSFMELRRSRYGKPFLGSTGYPDDQFAIWSVPLSHPCPECGAPLRKPPKNRKVPTVICAGPELEHVFEADTFELAQVTTMEVVPGIEAYDPECGGTPLSVPEEWPAAPSLTLVDERKPKPKGKKAATAKKKAATAKKKTGTGKKKAAKKS